MSVYLYHSQYNGAGEYPGLGYSVDSHSAGAMKEQLKGRSVIPIVLLDSSYLKKAFNEKRGTLIVPGGNFTLLSHELQGMIQKIRDAIGNGWNYGGICSGGIFGAKDLTMRVDLDPTSKQRTSYPFSSGFLNLLPVQAELETSPPVNQNPPPNYTDQAGRWIVDLFSRDHSRFQTVWWKGMNFKILNPKKVTIEATYQYPSSDVNTAAVSGLHGYGQVFFTTFHPELSFTNRERFLEPKESSANRETFVHDMYDYLQIGERLESPKNQCRS